MIESKDLTYIISAHNFKAKEPAKRMRKWDLTTPYSIHPIWCAMTILHEPLLSKDIRERGSLVLGYHDIPEDTNASLPDWLSQEVRGLIMAMKFDSSEDEWKNLWKKDKEVRLYKLYDKTGNMLDGAWMEKERRMQHLAHLQKLTEDVRKNYGTLNIVRIAGTFG